jgi:hypothetical protein
MASEGTEMAKEIENSILWSLAAAFGGKISIVTSKKMLKLFQH